MHKVKSSISIKGKIRYLCHLNMWSAHFFHLFLDRINQTVNIIKHTVGIEEKGIRLRLNIIDTPGFGDAINNTKWWAHPYVPCLLMATVQPQELRLKIIPINSRFSHFVALTKILCLTISWQSIEDYIDQQFEQYFRDESGLNRRNIQDNRVHCCLYFISPFSHGYAEIWTPLVP